VKYIVDWIDEVVAKYQAIYKKATDRGAVYRAVEAIDLQLQVDPNEKGESREGNQRIFLQKPLGVVFEVDAAQRKVYVISLWRTHRPPTTPQVLDSEEP
jgi:hypothetical protein